LHEIGKQETGTVGGTHFHCTFPACFDHFIGYIDTNDEPGSSGYKLQRVPPGTAPHVEEGPARYRLSVIHCVLKSFIHIPANEPVHEVAYETFLVRVNGIEMVYCPVPVVFLFQQGVTHMPSTFLIDVN